MHRFFAPDLDPAEEAVLLPRDEAEHLTRVLRLGHGDVVAIFDGRGSEFVGKVARAHGAEVRVQLVERVEPVAEADVALTLAQAVLKGEKMDDIVRDAVMLGVAAIQPIVTRRSETTVASLVRSARVDRWRRIALASVKQSRRAVLPDVRRPLSFENFLVEPAPALRLMLVEPGVTTSAAPLAALRGEPTPPDAAIWVGPEGGWTREECAAAISSGARPITLGRRTLRADAVPVVAVCVLQFIWGDF